MLGEQLDIFALPTLAQRFEWLAKEGSGLAQAKKATRLAKKESLPVAIIIDDSADVFSHRVMVVGSNYCLNAFNCREGAEQFIARHRLNVATPLNASLR